MAIYRLLKNYRFGPREIGRMTKAYEYALDELGLARSDPMTETIAIMIVEIAQTGEEDPRRISALAIEGLRFPSEPSGRSTAPKDDDKSLE